MVVYSGNLPPPSRNNERKALLIMEHKRLGALNNSLKWLACTFR
jgi:hypothetical protein